MHPSHNTTSLQPSLRFSTQARARHNLCPQQLRQHGATPGQQICRALALRSIQRDPLGQGTVAAHVPAQASHAAVGQLINPSGTTSKQLFTNDCSQMPVDSAALHTGP